MFYSASFVAAAQQPAPPAWVQVVPFILIFVIFYFIAIRPQQKRQKELDEMVKSLKPGDKVVTNGGIVGVVVAIKDKTISIRSADTKLEMLKTSVSGVTSGAETTGQS